MTTGHNEISNVPRDQQRTAFLRQAGLKVIRVLNDDVMSDLEAVARYIARQAGVELE